MKAKKLAKIVVLTLITAALLGIAVGFSASAAEAESEVTILAQNIVYGDRVAIAYAVNVPIENANTVTVNYYWKDDPTNIKTATLLDTTKEENLYIQKDENGNEIARYPVFVTTGVPAKDLSRVAYAVAYTGDTAPEYTHDYSVAEYLYTMLYREGFKDMTDADGKDFERMKLYNSLLTYGVQAQVVLENYGSANPEPLVTESVYAYTETEGVTINGSRFSFAPAGETLSVTPAYTGSETVASWALVRADGYTETLAVGETASITEPVQVVPVFGEAESSSYDFEDGQIPYDSNFSIAMNIYSGNTASTSNILDGGNVNPGSYDMSQYSSYTGPKFYIGTDPTSDANKVLTVQTNKVSSSVASTWKIALDKKVENGGIYVFEYDQYVDFTYSTNTNAKLFSATLYNESDAKTGADFYCRPDTTDTDSFALGNTSADTNAFDIDTWYTFRIVWDSINKVRYIYYSTNGGTTFTLFAEADLSSGTNNSTAVEYIQLSFTGGYSNTNTQYFDNVYFYETDTMPQYPGV